MAAIAFDTLKAARRLKEVGVPEAQAEAQAELMAEAFVFNMDSLITKDYLEQCLDARFAVHDARLMAHIDGRFVEQDARLDARLDARFAEQDARLDTRFAEQDKRFEKQDARFEKQDARFEKLDGRFEKHESRFDRIDARLANHDLQFADIRGELKLHRWMLALIAASTVIPALQKLFSLVVG
jgi:hypothetical protein